MITRTQALVFLISLLVGGSRLPQQGNFPPSGSGSSFPLTTAGAVVSGGSISVTPGTNGSIAGVQTAAPPMGLYEMNQCPISNTSACFYTPSNTQLAQNCS